MEREIRLYRIVYAIGMTIGLTLLVLLRKHLEWMY